MAVAEQKIRNGNLNKVLAEDSAIHDWYRFVLSFPPHLVRTYLDKFEVGAGMKVLDPFCGTGTTLVESKKKGIDSVGIEANPVAHFASEVKVDWSVNPDKLWSHAQRIGDEVHHRLQATNGLLSGAFKGSARSNQLLSLEEPVQKLLLTNSISPLPLHKALVLLERINNSRT